MDRVPYEEWQLTSLFEVEPEHPSPEDPWPYREVVYSVSQGEMELSCAIHPAHRDVRLVLRHCGNVVYELDALALDRIEPLEDRSGGSLRLALSERERIVLRIKPTIRIDHDFSGAE